MTRKIGVVGMGHVGATVAHIIVAQGLADTLVLYDRNEGKVTSDTLDFQDAASLLPTHTNIINGGFEELADCEVIISALGRIDLIKEGGDRFSELKANAPSVTQVGQELKKVNFNGKLVVITNPNDVITSIYQANIGLPTHQVLGTGTYLDTARLKRQVGDALHIDPRSVSGYMLGEHGFSQFAAWSTVRVEGRPFTEIAKEKNIDLVELEKKIVHGGYAVHVGKGYTNFAIATAATSLAQLILSDAKNVAICSHYNEEFQDYISSPALIGKDGVERVLELPLTDEEKAKLKKSSDKIKANKKKFM